MTKILITGASGQLGSALQKFSKGIDNLKFFFTNEKELDITKPDKVLEFFATHEPDYCVNCAAYTAVDRAEGESELAFKINRNGVENLVRACMFHDTTFIQVSTDFVFDGTSNVPYKETDRPNPINVYGISKYEAEQITINLLEKYFIIRTAWLYSEFGNNFLKTMIKIGREKDEIRVINDQFGNPTYACDLAKFILSLIKSNRVEYGIYHFVNQGVTTWYEFAERILKLYNPKVKVLPIDSMEYQSAANRPMNSSLDLTKTKQTFAIEIPEWGESLKECLKQIRLHERESS